MALEDVTADHLNQLADEFATLQQDIHHFWQSQRNTPAVRLKVDVQGHEVEVLKGATKSLDHIDVVLLECSFAEEYKNTLPSFAHASSLLLDHGLYPVIFRDYWRRLSPYAWERDVIFVKRRLIDALWGW